MDEKKIAFIIHRTDDDSCAETINSLAALEIPEDFEIELLPLAGEKKFSAYNAAMNQSDAKYKIYLDEKVSVVNKNILPMLVELFRSDEKIGIIGTSGATELSTHGICLNSAKRCGKIFSDEVKELTAWSDEKNFCEAEAVDGWFLATQYDFAWREDLFQDDYFGDAAQCAEFRRRGYKSFIGVDDEPQIWVRANELTINDQARKNFLEEYSAELFPLVSVIIPTFNRPKFFREALESVLSQTYRNFEIFITDNSTNDETEILMRDYLEKFPGIKYFHHENFSANDNWNFARDYNNPRAEYVNWLMDDDLFYPRKFEFMVEIFRNNPDVSLVTSIRDKIDEEGKVTGQMFRPIMLPRKNAKLRGDEAVNILFQLMENFIGEPTTAMIRKKFLRDNDICWHEDERGYYPLNDVLTWCQVLRHGDLFYFYEQPLSAFRWHEGQSTHWAESIAGCEIVWAKAFKSAWEEKVFLKSEEDLRSCILHWLEVAVATLARAHNEKYSGKWVDYLAKTLTAMSESLYNGYEIILPEIEE